MTVDYLCRHPEYIDTLAGWIYSEFVVGSPRASTLEKIAEMLSKTSETEWPVTLVATEDGRPTGTVSIFSNDLKTQNELTPWLAAVIVAPAFRNRGIAASLIRSACAVAKRRGVGILYLRTEHAARYYERLGWQFVRRAVDEYGIETDVYRYIL